MRMKTLLLAPALLCGCSPQAQAPETPQPTTISESNMSDTAPEIYGVTFTSISGEPMPFSTFAGKVTLVVNTASQCGYTGQYDGLQELYTTFEADGFSVLGVPSNDFGGQEPGSEEQIASFCKLNYGVEFPLTKKTVVSGAEQHDFWKQAKGALGEKAEPKWNFHKVLVGKDGQFIQAYPSAVRPADVELVADIERALSAE